MWSGAEKQKTLKDFLVADGYRLSLGLSPKVVFDTNYRQKAIIGSGDSQVLYFSRQTSSCGRSKVLKPQLNHFFTQKKHGNLAPWSVGTFCHAHFASRFSASFFQGPLSRPPPVPGLGRASDLPLVHERSHLHRCQVVGTAAGLSVMNCDELTMDAMVI